MGYAAKLGSASSAELLFVNLGAETSINVKNNATLGPYYADLTTNNFFYRIASGSASRTGISWTANAFYGNFDAPSISYNNNTGVLTATHGNVYGILRRSDGDFRTNQSGQCTTTKYGYCIK